MPILSDPIDATEQAPKNFALGSDTGFLENLASGSRRVLDVGLNVSKSRAKAIAFDDVIPQLNAGRAPEDRLTNPYSSASWSLTGSDSEIVDVPNGRFRTKGVQAKDEEARVFAAIQARRKTEPAYLPGFPADAAGLEQKTNRETNTSIDLADDVANRATLLGSAGNFLGSMGAYFRAPLNLITGLVGGPSRTIVGAALKEGAANAFAQAVQEPSVAQNYADLGREYGVGDALESIATAGLGGGVLGGGFKALGKIRSLGDTAAYATGKAGDIVREFRAKVKDPTPIQAAAIKALEEEHEIDLSSPLPDTDANNVQHLANLQAHIDRLEEVDAPGEPVPTVEPAELKSTVELKSAAAEKVDSYDPRDLKVDAERFQFKSGADAAGVLPKLRGVEEWSPVLSGKAIVWEALDGTKYIADGHQRHGLATRLLEKNPQANIVIDAVTLREADGFTSEMARTYGALKNIVEETGTAIDAAKVLRVTGENTPLPIPPGGALIRDARPIARLSDEAFGMVVNGVVKPEFAAVVGRLAASTPDLQGAYLALLARLDPPNLTQAEIMVGQMVAAGGSKETQLGLFGEEIVAKSLYIERARIFDNAMRRLRDSKKTFKSLTDNASNIEAAGNVLATDANAAKVTNNARAIEILGRLANRAGPVSDALGRAAESLAAGRSSKAAVGTFIDELDGLNLSELANGAERGNSDGNVSGGNGRESGVEQTPGTIPREPEEGDAGTPGLNPALEQAAGDALEDHQASLFGDPHGPAVAAQIDMLAHDVKAAEDAAAAAAEDAGGDFGGLLADDAGKAPEGPQVAAKADLGATEPVDPKATRAVVVEVPPPPNAGGRTKAERVAAAERAKRPSYVVVHGDDISVGTSLQGEAQRWADQLNGGGDWNSSARPSRNALRGEVAGLDQQEGFNRAIAARDAERARVAAAAAEPVDPNIAAKNAQLAQLEADSPLARPDQSDVDGLGLFDTARSPSLFGMGERLDDNGRVVAELRTADDVLGAIDSDAAAFDAIGACLL